MKKWYEVNVSVEKVITRTIEANSEEEVIELVERQLMTSNEEFAQILDVYVEEIND
ncbi:hypothetical protein [Lysinibacillus fusiformis]|uniref:hypothetical protein n=1 Tax=Lysinibacillus fusiformis TaxID=28031 RepID=UPI00263A9793|nr:hypothetical protein [Lysinibacillus fusiformis]MDC6267315.1 hypothetical protein [Lysinibacillus sphaericus]MDN4968251.1 hypothetical protein [Lysinibacillus fusiformis]MDN4968425.1 hypothetical protein [Lysinibacillus fusiformis]